jgi:acyl-homoserine lactone acylase PvdQ
MRTTIHWLLISLIIFSIACTKQSSTDLATIQKWETQASTISIIRDDFGVPHIYGKSDADAVFGLLYAQCEDDFRRVERNYIWATGRLAELEGEEALYSDLRAHLYMTQEEAIAAYESAPQWLKELCNAYADGINYYLHKNPEVEPQVITHYEPWFPMYFSEGSIGGDIEQISTRRIKAFYEDRKSLALNEYGNGLEQASFYDEPKGSNGIAISGDLTTSGNALLLINPHTSFYFRPEVHVVSEEGLNAYGAVTWGQFFVYQGFNEKTGWMHTSTYVDFIDEFVQEISEVDGKLVYQYGDEQRDVDVQEITLKFKDGEQIKERSFPMYRTHHGPITHMVDDKWVVTKINWDPVNALIQSFTRTKLQNFVEFNEMMDIRTNSSNNTVFADAEGNIGYFHGNFIPKRSPEFDFSKPVDGSNPATDWMGKHEVDESIVVLNPASGWLQNCNSTPFTVAGKYSPKQEDYPAYMAPDKENYRGIHAISLLEKADNLDIDKLIELAYDPFIPAFQKIIPPLVAAMKSQGSSSTAMNEAVDVLAKWDYKTHENSVGMALSHFYGLNYNREIGSINELIDVDVNAMKYTKEEQLKMLAVFESTLEELTTKFGSWNTAWGDINRFQRLNADISMKFDDNEPSLPVGLASGRWGALAAYGAYVTEETNRIYGRRGNSFVAVVEFGDKVKAKSIIAGGQNADPNSPHFYDQAEMYTKGQFKEVAFYKEDILARAKENYIPGDKR